MIQPLRDADESTSVTRAMHARRPPASVNALAVVYPLAGLLPGK
jgi:hypothetical protein